jgi:hypothetical protein
MGERKWGRRGVQVVPGLPEGHEGLEDLDAADALELLAQAPSRVGRGWPGEPIEGSVSSDRLLFVRPAL